jgi:hypothetical protein
VLPVPPCENDAVFLQGPLHSIVTVFANPCTKSSGLPRSGFADVIVRRVDVYEWLVSQSLGGDNYQAPDGGPRRARIGKTGTTRSDATQKLAEELPVADLQWKKVCLGEIEARRRRRPR